MTIPTDITDNLRTEINPQATREASSDRACEAYQKRVALVGRFGGMNQREAANVLRSYVAKWLVQFDEVQAYSSAPAQQGGLGATLVMLRKSERARAANRERQQKRRG